MCEYKNLGGLHNGKVHILAAFLLPFKNNLLLVSFLWLKYEVGEVWGNKLDRSYDFVIVLLVVLF